MDFLQGLLSLRDRGGGTLLRAVTLGSCQWRSTFIVLHRVTWQEASRLLLKGPAWETHSVSARSLLTAPDGEGLQGVLGSRRGEELDAGEHLMCSP